MLLFSSSTLSFCQLKFAIRIGERLWKHIEAVDFVLTFSRPHFPSILLLYLLTGPQNRITPLIIFMYFRLLL